MPIPPRTAHPNDHAGSVLELLVMTYPALLTAEEVRGELDIGNDADDALYYLWRMGLAHKLKGFYWATRAAITGADIAI